MQDPKPPTVVLSGLADRAALGTLCCDTPELLLPWQGINDYIWATVEMHPSIPY